MRILTQFLLLIVALALGCLCEHTVATSAESCHSAISLGKEEPAQVADAALWDRSASGPELSESGGTTLLGGPNQTSRPIVSGSKSSRTICSLLFKFRHLTFTGVAATPLRMPVSPMPHQAACQYYVIALRHIIR